MMYAVIVDHGYRQVHEHLLGKKCVVDMHGEELTEMQFILKQLELEYKDIEY